jgi:coenzyme F420-reducing hydrogenase delta subunit
MCSGRVDLDFILRAFLNGQDGVFVGGCRLGECNYITHGNYDALSNVYLCKKIMDTIGLNPERLRIEFMSGAEGNLLAEVTNDFTQKVKALGPFGEGEGIDEKELKFRLKAVRKLVPYLKLVERERLRVPIKSEEAYAAFFESDEVNTLFNELFSDKVAISQIMLLLKQKHLSTLEISEKLDLKPSEVLRHMSSSSRQGLVKYDLEQKCYALA